MGSTEAGAVRRSSVTRLRLLDTAAVLILERGCMHLTLDALREAAGVSKGGLLYHFASKGALMEALVDRLADRFVGQVEERVAAYAHSHAPLALSYLECIARIGEAPVQPYKALTTVCMMHPELIAKVRERLACIALDREPAGADRLHSIQLRLIADGLWAADLFNHHGMDSALRAAVLRSLGAAEERGGHGHY